MSATSIEWTDVSWNPIRGCSRVSEGCRHCYAETMAGRFAKAWGSPEIVTERGTWSGVLSLAKDKLDEPLRWRAPRRVFVNSMSDLFHERVPDEWIDRVFAVMALAPQHTFQVLTKRPERMRAWIAARSPAPGTTIDLRIAGRALDLRARHGRRWDASLPRWPLPNVWIGVSVENRAALPRIDALRATPAAVRFVSFEPLLEDLGDVDLAWIDWAIFGGESGAGARICCVDWIRRGIASCRAQGVVPFVKQLGDSPTALHSIVNMPGKAIQMPLDLSAPKGGDPAEWPEDLRVREFPS